MMRAACAFLLLVAGCGSSGSGRSDGADDGAEDPPATPVRGTGSCTHIEIAYFVARPRTIDPGASSTLSWDGRMARGCDLEPGGIPVGVGMASRMVTPSSTTEYSLRCFGTACLDVDDPDAPVARVTVTVR